MKARLPAAGIITLRQYELREGAGRLLIRRRWGPRIARAAVLALAGTYVLSVTWTIAADFISKTLSDLPWALVATLPGCYLLAMAGRALAPDERVFDRLYGQILRAGRPVAQIAELSGIHCLARRAQWFGSAPYRQLVLEGVERAVGPFSPMGYAECLWLAKQTAEFCGISWDAETSMFERPYGDFNLWLMGEAAVLLPVGGGLVWWGLLLHQDLWGGAADHSGLLAHTAAAVLLLLGGYLGYDLRGALLEEVERGLPSLVAREPPTR